METSAWISKGVIVRMSDGWWHVRREVRVLCMLEKSSRDALAHGVCVPMSHLQPAFVSPVNRGRQRQDNKCEMCDILRS